VLAVALSGYKEVIDHAYDLAAIGRYVEFMSVMSYDYHGAWERVLGHVSPLYYRSGDQFPQYNTVGLQSLPSVQHCMILVISLSTTQYVCSHFPQHNTVCLQSLPSAQHSMFPVTSLSTTQYVCSHFPQHNTVCLQSLPSLQHSMFTVTSLSTTQYVYSHFPQHNTVCLQLLPSVQHSMFTVTSLSTTQYVCSHFPQYNTICLCTISGSHSTMAHNVHLQINIVRKYSFKSNAMIYIQYTVLQC